MRKDAIEAVLVGGVSLLVGCTEDGGRTTGSEGSGIISASVSDSATDSASGTDSNSGTSSMPNDDGSGTTSGDDSDGNGDNTPLFDLGVMPDVEMQEEMGCQKVDFLFVVDNSGSMGDDQVNLANNFPNFINGIQATLQDVQSYQVGVVSTDAYAFNGAGCAGQLGGLVTKTGGTDSSNMQCTPYASGKNYMTEADDLAAKFACAAKVGSEGDGFERPMNAVETVVTKQLGGAGQCNEGYIRDDALLVIVIITDEWDGPNDPDGFLGIGGCNNTGGSCGNAQSWYDTVVNAKGGIADNIVVLSLIHPLNDPNCAPTDGYTSGDIEPFTNMFTHGFIGCIASDYAAIFTEATSIIEDACANFEPPG